MINIEDFKLKWYFDGEGCIKADKICPVLIEEGKCSKKTDICPTSQFKYKEGFKCVWAYTYIIHKYGIR